ncbi:hypothetical protein Tco_0094228, partial [Tanacetum coccineum]
MGSSDKCCFSFLKACYASDVQWKSLFLMHFVKVLNSSKDFSADLERNLFRLANFPLRLWTSLIVSGDMSRITTSVLSGHGFIPSELIILIFRNVRNVSSISLSISVSVVLEAEGHFGIAIYSMASEYPSRILSRCSATDRGTPVMSDDYHANILVCV